MPYRVSSPHQRRGFYLLLVAGAVAGLAALGLTIGSSLSHNNTLASRALGRADRALIHQTVTRAEAEQARALAQALLRESVARCVDQNRRHRATVHELDHVLRLTERHSGPRHMREIRSSRRFTVLLIDQLVPLRDCQRLRNSA